MLVSTRTTNVLLVLLLAVGIGIVAILASGVRGGPLDPPGAPASTMHTLDDVYGSVQNVPQSWDQVLNSTNGGAGPIPPAGCNSDRFKCVMGYSQCGTVCLFAYPAVLDEETSLVWQRAPAAIATGWDAANSDCSLATTGKRMGWRLPTLAQLQSLVDATTLTLPSGHPFTGIETAPTSLAYWSSTEDFTFSTVEAWAYQFGSTVGGPVAKGFALNVWCVRGDTSNR